MVEPSSVFEDVGEDENEVDELRSEKPREYVAVLEGKGSRVRSLSIRRAERREGMKRSTHLTRSELEVILHVHQQSDRRVSHL